MRPQGSQTESPAGDRAVVIGGSIAGMCAAKVLSDHFAEVVVVERDRFPTAPGPRKGVPQARHVHALLTRGEQVLERLFPGLAASLEQAGALRVDWGGDALYHGIYGWSPHFETGLTGISASRDLLEWHVRAHLARCANVRFLENLDATGLIATPDGQRVVGIRLRSRDPIQREGGAPRPAGLRAGLPPGADDELPAGLVVDAGGRSSPAPKWLQALGFPPAAETTVNAYLGYTTRWYRRPPDMADGWKALLTRAIPPNFPRGGGIVEVEGGQWVVTLAGMGRDYPPTDETGFVEFTRSLASPLVYESIQRAEPLSDIYAYQRTENRMRHFERMERWPEGFLVLGDAACAFNPVYGQGMTTAALGAEALGECLRQFGPQSPALASDFQKRLAKVNAVPWMMATSEDFRWPTTVGGKPGTATRLMHWYIDQVLALASKDRQIHGMFLAVSQLVSPPGVLFQPRIASLVLKHSLRRRKATDALKPEKV